VTHERTLSRPGSRFNLLHLRQKTMRCEICFSEEFFVSRCHPEEGSSRRRIWAGVGGSVLKERARNHRDPSVDIPESSHRHSLRHPLHPLPHRGDVLVLARLSHRFSTAANDVPHSAAIFHLRVLRVMSSTRPRATADASASHWTTSAPDIERLLNAWTCRFLSPRPSMELRDFSACRALFWWSDWGAGDRHRCTKATSWNRRH